MICMSVPASRSCARCDDPPYTGAFSALMMSSWAYRLSGAVTWACASMIIAAPNRYASCRQMILQDVRTRSCRSLPLPFPARVHKIAADRRLIRARKNEPTKTEQQPLSPRTALMLPIIPSGGHMRSLLRVFFGGVVALVLLPSSVWAQAAITGVVKDASGAVLPGVTVEAASP